MKIQKTCIQQARPHQYLKNGFLRLTTVQPGSIQTMMVANLDLPSAHMDTSSQVADDIFKTHRKSRNTIYARWFWRWIMAVIEAIFKSIFKRPPL